MSEKRNSMSFISNLCLTTGKIPDTLKRVGVTPIFKKGNNNNKENIAQ